MKKPALLLVPLVALALVVVFVTQKPTGMTKPQNPLEQNVEPQGSVIEPTKETEPKSQLANPASVYCTEHGGTLEIITQNSGGQFGLCHLPNYSCEEWAYFRGECTVEADAPKIYQALQEKGLNLSEMEVKIYKHFGKFISGGVSPVSGLGGGGYVFAVKEGDSVKIVADGNGAIMCSMLDPYPDFPAYLIPECIDDGGNVVVRE